MPVQSAGGSQLAVIGPDGNSVLPFTGHGGQRHLRRTLLAQAPVLAPMMAVPAVAQGAPPPPTSPAVHAMASQAGNAALQKEVQAMCQQAAWMLMLSAGQNEFTIFVTPPGIASQVSDVPHQPPPPPLPLAGADVLTFLLYTYSHCVSTHSPCFLILIYFPFFSLSSQLKGFLSLPVLQTCCHVSVSIGHLHCSVASLNSPYSLCKGCWEMTDGPQDLDMHSWSCVMGSFLVGMPCSQGVAARCC